MKKNVLLFVLLVLGRLGYAQAPKQQVNVSVKEIVVGENLLCKEKIKAHVYQADSLKNKEGQSFITSFDLNVSKKPCKRLIQCKKVVLGLRECGNHIEFLYDEKKHLFWAIDTSEEIAQAVADAKAEGYLNFFGDTFLQENIDRSKKMVKYCHYFPTSDAVEIINNPVNQADDDIYQLHDLANHYKFLTKGNITKVLNAENKEIAVLMLGGFSNYIGNAYYFISDSGMVKLTWDEIVKE
ncbi:MAG: hypothetical protein ACKVTZ_00555 [Bacteroidia bacterium]